MRHGTYSIVAHDPLTGALGVAVQSHWFSVGSLVAWARPGVGAVATQSVVEPAYGPRALELLAAGDGAPTALAALLGGDEHADVRQVAVVDAAGAVAASTGAGCVPHAGDEAGDGFSCQANMMGSDRVWGAMAQGFRASAGRPLAERLLDALDAGEAAGGDARGRQSAALLVVSGERAEPWRREVDLRVEDHPEPLEELRRLERLRRAYALAGEGDDLVAAGCHAEAGERFTQAAGLAPEKDELVFWAGLAAVDRGEREEGLRLVRRALEVNPGWRTLLAQLPAAVAPSAGAVLEALARPG